MQNFKQEKIECHQLRKSNLKKNNHLHFYFVES